MTCLTDYFAKESWSGAGRQVDAKEVDWYTRQCHSYSHQRVDGVTVEGHHHQEYGAQAEDDWEEQRQLWEAERGNEEVKRMNKERKVVRRSHECSQRLERKTV